MDVDTNGMGRNVMRRFGGAQLAATCALLRHDPPVVESVLRLTCPYKALASLHTKTAMICSVCTQDSYPVGA